MIDVTAALMIRDGKILIAQRGGGEKLGGKWEFPGGKIEENESPEFCLKRELREEFGIDVEVGEFFHNSEFEYPEIKINLMAYWVKKFDGDMNLSVHSRVKWIDFGDLKRYDFAPADIPIVGKLMKEFEEG